MVKLIRLKGDSTANNKIISNTFTDNIIVEPGSRIGVRSAYADILNTATQELFIITDYASYEYNVSNSDISMSVSPRQGTYQNIHSLLRELQVRANGIAEDSNTQPRYLGVHNIWLYKANKSVLQVYQGILDDPQFDSEWVFTQGDTALILTPNSIDCDGSDEVIGYLAEVIPLVSNRFEGQLVNTQPFALNAVIYDDPNTVIWGFDITTNPGFYTLNYRSNESLQNVLSAIATANNDIFKLEKFGTRVRLTVTNGGVEKGVLESDLDDEALNYQSLFYELLIPNGSTANLDNCQCITIDSLDPTKVSATRNVDVEASFNDNLLSSYLGFSESSYDFSGDPAILESPKPPQGTISYPGVMITLDGPILSSYSGTARGNGGSVNILDVVSVESSFTRLRYSPNYPLLLDINNSRAINIRDLRLQFIRDTDNIPLEFIGNPIIVLEVHGPNE